MFNCLDDDNQSACVEGPDEIDQVVLSLILDLLLLHAQVVVVTIVGVYDDLVKMANYADLSICLHIVLRPLLQLALLHVNLGLVHDLHIEPLVFVDAVNLAVLGVLNQLQDVITVHDNTLLLLSRHIVA